MDAPAPEAPVPEVLVIGAGPAGLMAAEVLTAAGVTVLIAEAQATPARKFLMAGKSGLNLTKDEPAGAFAREVSAGWLRPMVEAFGPDQVRGWAEGLDISLFTGSSGRVFPVGMKASPLLRAWLRRLAAQGAVLRTGWRWQGFDGDALAFATLGGQVAIRPRVAILALGGASWPRLGSDATWVEWLANRRVSVNPFRPANMGFEVAWSPRMERHFGQPVKGVMLMAGDRRLRAEFVLSARGVEGGGIYALSALLRDGARLTLDLAPDRSEDDLARRLARPRGKDSRANHLRKASGLDPVKLALFLEWGQPLPDDPLALARRIKALPARLGAPHPIAEAISSAGGIAQDSLTGDLELRHLPGFFAAGEMLDWEAPTGGYLLTACLATGRHAALGALRQLGRSL